MMKKRSLTFTLLSVVCTMSLLSGCALIHNDTPPHTQLAPEQIRLADDIHLASNGWPAAQWWTRYQDPQLNALIDRALAKSPSMTIAQTRVAQAESQVDLLNAGTNLQIAAFGMLNRQKASANGFLGPYSQNFPALGLTGPWYTEGTVGLFASFNIDLWGRERSMLEASIGAHNARVAEVSVVELELAADVAQLYYSIQTTYQLLALLEQTHKILEYAVEAHQSKATQGLEAKVPFHGARGQLLNVERQMTAARSQIKQTRETIRALIGAGADDLLEIKSVPLPQSAASLPATLSYELLARRPDLQAMRWYVQASLNQVDAAKAAFYPSFDIKALFALDSIHLSKLFKSSSQQINLIPGLYLPIFDGGRLNANLHGTRAASDMLIEQYNQSVLNAVRDVAISGSRLQALDEEWQLQKDKVESATFLQNSLEAAYKQGLNSRLIATEAHLPVILEQVSLLMLDSQRLAQEIILTKALGGGYSAETSTNKTSTTE